MCVAKVAKPVLKGGGGIHILWPHRMLHRSRGVKQTNDECCISSRMSRTTAALTDRGPTDSPAVKPALCPSSGRTKTNRLLQCNEKTRWYCEMCVWFACDTLECWCVSPVPDVVELAVFCSTGCGPGYDTVFSVVLMCSVQRSDAGCKCPLSSWLNPLTCARLSRKIQSTSRCTHKCTFIV